MTDAANITIEPDAQLNIYINFTGAKKNASATIISNSGETIQQIPLVQGRNVVNITPFLNKNYAVRVVNGENVTVQKI